MRDIKYYITLLGVSVFCFFGACSSPDDDIPSQLIGNSLETSDSISVISSDDPMNSTRAAYQADTNIIIGDESYTIEIAFGSRLKNVKYYEVTVESEDFEITKNCPDRYEIGWKYYSDEDFYIPYGTDLTYDSLPMKFTVTLDKKWKKQTYSGCVEIKIIGYARGAIDGATVRLYYYGDNDLICFSSQKQAATNIYMMKKG